MRLAAHGISLELPQGWEGKILRRPGAVPLLHAASFPLPPQDGDFGSGATAQMPPGGALLVLKEYRAGSRLRPGRGLFAAGELPLPLSSRGLSRRTLQVNRPGQRGMQHFFTSQGRPFCLYVVIADPAAAAPSAHGAAARILSRCSLILRSLHVERGVGR